VIDNGNAYIVTDFHCLFFSGGKDFAFNSTTYEISKHSTLESLKMKAFCSNLVIYGDLLKEEDEKFRIVFTAITPDIFNGHKTNAVKAAIMNDDCKCFSYGLFYKNNKLSFLGLIVTVIPCPELKPPKNGTVLISEKKSYLEAIYKCSNPKLWLIPYMDKRVCTSDSWNGSTPVCCRFL